MCNNFSKLGLGTSTIASFGRSLSFKKAKALFDLALNFNISTIDTSDAYGSGDAERLIGKIIKKKRNDFFIITKAGYQYLSLPGILSPLNQIGKKIIQGLKIKKCFKKEYILSSIEKSLKRLNIDHLDAFLLHDPTLEDLLQYNDECWEALYLIKKKGLSKFIGISSNDYTAHNLALNNINLDLIQARMIFDKKYETLFHKVKKNDSKLIVYSVFNQKINKNLNTKIDQLLESFNITKEDKKSILITYCIIYKKVDCALFRTHDINHLKQMALGFEKYKKNYNDFFLEIDKKLNDNQFR